MKVALLYSSLGVGVGALCRAGSSMHPADAYGSVVLLMSAACRVPATGLAHQLFGTSSPPRLPLLVFQAVGILAFLVGRYLQERWEEEPGDEPMRLSGFCGD